MLKVRGTCSMDPQEGLSFQVWVPKLGPYPLFSRLGIEGFQIRVHTKGPWL